MTRWIRALALAVFAPIALSGCLFIPGKFDSTLDVRADRSFTFTYKGEVLAADLEGMLGSTFSSLSAMGKDAKADEDAIVDDDDAASDTQDDATANEDDSAQADAAKPATDPEEAAKKAAERDAKLRALAETLSSEAGYNKVEYRGEGVFFVDYAIKGTLTHGFAFPFNQDAGMIFPWVTIELRGKDAVRVRATGFAKQDASALSGMGGSAPESRIDGRFTLTTDTEIVSQNNEAGVAKAGKTTTIAWKLTPSTIVAPTVVLRVAPM